MQIKEIQQQIPLSRLKKDWCRKEWQATKEDALFSPPIAVAQMAIDLREKIHWIDCVRLADRVPEFSA